MSDSNVQPGWVIWVTGLSGAGKTTLARAVAAHARGEGDACVMLDGNEFREAFTPDAGFSEADRAMVAERITAAAKLLSLQGVNVVVATISMQAATFERNRAHLPRYLEVYIEAGLEFLRTRDPRGLYAAAPDGEPVVGESVSWSPPQRPDVRLRAEDLPDPRATAAEVVALARSRGESPVE